MKWKTPLFSLVAVGLVLLLAEAVLALAGVRPLIAERDPWLGFSRSVRVFEREGEVWRTPPRAVAHSFNDQRFLADKPADGLRVFVLGGSSAYGFPWGAPQAFPRALESALSASAPGRTVEVVNAAAMSYGSHRLRILVHELLEHEPDLLIVYAGHNEYVERDFYRRHVADAPAPAGLRALLYRWRLYSALTRLLEPHGGRPVEDAAAADSGELIGLDVSREYAGEVGAGEREEVGERFEQNLTAIVEAARRRGVPVVLCTVPSNLSGWRPNRSVFPAGLGAAERAEVEQAAAAAREANDHGEPGAALAAVDRALARAPEHGGAWFERGRALAALERDGAGEAFRRARDHDGQPGRASAALNEAIRRVAGKTGALLVDVERAFVRLAATGTPGFDLFEDYVHPKPAAHLAIAYELWRALLESGLAGVEGDGDAATFRAALGLPADFDYAGGETPSAATAANTPSLMFNLAVVLENQGREADAVARYRECLALDPGYYVARVNLARLLRRSGRYAEAAAEYRGALEVDPGHLRSWIGLGESLRLLGRPVEAERAFERAVSLEGRSADAWNGLGTVLSRQGSHAEAEAAFGRAVELDPDRTDARSNLGLALLFQGRLDDAEAAFRELLERAPEEHAAWNGLGAVLLERGRLDEAAGWFRRSLEADPGDRFARDGLAEVERLRLQR